jgi:ribonuclease P protein component
VGGFGSTPIYFQIAPLWGYFCFLNLSIYKSVAKQFTLGKNERLKSRKSIELLFKEGKKTNLSPYLVYFITSPISSGLTEFPIQFGVGVATRNFKKAVDRNRIKRVTKEAYRLQKITLQEKLQAKNIQLNLFFIYTARELPEYKEVYKKVEAILKRIETIIDEIK